MWIVQPLQIADTRGAPVGRWRLTAKSDEGGGGPHRLCDCPDAHPTPESAHACPEAQNSAKAY